MKGARVPLRGVFVSQAIGQTLQRLGGDVVFGLMGSGKSGVTNAIVAAGGRFVSARHETGALCMADGYARVSGRLGVASRPPGAGADERDHGPDRGREVAHAADPARGRHARRAAALELPDRPGGARGVRGCGGGAGVRACDRGRGRDARRADRGGRAARGRADASARRAGRGGGAHRAGAVAGVVAGPAVLGARGGGPCWRAPSGRRSSAGAARCCPVRDRRCGASARLTRRRPGDLRGRQRALRRRPVRGRHLGRVRLAGRPAAARRGRRDRSPSGPR